MEQNLVIPRLSQLLKIKNMFCIISDSFGKSHIESASYWVKDSYKMNTVDLLLKESGRKLYIHYYNSQREPVDTIVLGESNK